MSCPHYPLEERPACEDCMNDIRKEMARLRKENEILKQTFRETETILVSKESIEEAFEIVKEDLIRRIRQHGLAAYRGTHEAFGVVMEELMESMEAMIANDQEAFDREMADTGVGIIWAIAGSIERKKRKKEETDGQKMPGWPAT